MRTAPSAFLSVAVLAAAAVLAGCGSVSSSSSSASAPGPAAPSVSAAASAAESIVAAESAVAAGSEPAAAAGSVTGDQLCALVSVKDADGALRTSPPVTEQEPGTFVDGEPECGYASDDHSVIANVTIFDPRTTKFDLKHGAVSDAALKPVSGLGKSAAAGGPELDVLYGSRGLVVESFGTTDLTQAQLVALGKLELSRLS
ncbi:MAG TPA: hypothetical protein VGD91_16160 [Trebonia sp.]